MKLRIFILLLSYSCFTNAVIPEYALSFDGASTYVNMQNALLDVKTISFWINPNKTIDNNLTRKQAVLMRDNIGPGYLTEERFGLYFEESGKPNAGKLVFVCSGGNTEYSIASDMDVWEANVWYHVVIMIDPVNGLEMYVNGLKQLEFDSGVREIFFRTEGVTGDLYIGKWGALADYYLDAKLEEFKMWSVIRTASDIRANMCRILYSYPPELKAYLQFDNKSLNTVLSTNPGGYGGVLYNVTISHYKKSNAPIGIQSAYLYENNLEGKALNFSMNFEITVDSIEAMSDIPKGLQIYYNSTNGLGQIPGYNGWFGVWFNTHSVDYNATLDYGNLDSYCDSCAIVYSRQDRFVNNWTDRSKIPDNCEFLLPDENQGVAVAVTQREEYTVVDSLELHTGFLDTVIGCTGDFIVLEPNYYPNATYIWDDTLYQHVLNVSESGNHHIQIKYNGCFVEQLVFVDLREVPVFQLPDDTAICIGDTFWVSGPIDSAEYSWGGLYHTRAIGIYAAGTYPLTITKNGCSFTDEITVSTIPTFHIDLGFDTNMCLGESLVYDFNIPGVKYYWNDGDSSGTKTFFNTEGKFWLTAWNECFTRVDTINISYEDCECHIYVPNAFTPNNDGVNDIFKPITGCYYEEYEFDIIDRWGNFVFRSRDVSEGWDGSFKGGRPLQGSYNWRMRYKKYSWMKTTKYEYGTLNLIR